MEERGHLRVLSKEVGTHDEVEGFGIHHVKSVGDTL